MDSLIVDPATVAVFDTVAVVNAISQVTGLPEQAAYMLGLSLLALLARFSRLWKRFASKDQGMFPQWGPRLAGFALAGVFSWGVLGKADLIGWLEATLFSGLATIGVWEAGLQPIRGIWNGYIKPWLRRRSLGPAVLIGALVLGVSGGAAQAQDPVPGDRPDSVVVPPIDIPEPAVPRWDLKHRLSGGLGAGWVVYDDGLDQNFSGPALKLPLVFNLSKYLSAAGVGIADWQTERYQVDLGGLVGLAGLKAGSTYHVAVGVFYTWLMGDGWEELGDLRLAAGEPWAFQRMKLTINGSWLVLRDRDGVGVVAAQVIGAYIPDNNGKQYMGMLTWRAF